MGLDDVVLKKIVRLDLKENIMNMQTDVFYNKIIEG